jgi:hypothetical protein
VKSRIVGPIVVAASLAAATATAAPTATAASTFSCATNAYSYVLAVGSGTTDKGFLYSYRYSPMTSDSTVGTFATRVKIGSGWNVFGAIRAGRDGFIWGFKPDGTLYAYDWNVGATTWSRAGTLVKPPTGQSAPWASYTTTTGKKRVTVDSQNQIYTLDSSGRILKYAYSFTSNSWTTWAKPVAQLSSAYDMLWASDNATLWARTTAGTLTRLRLDPTTDRVVARFDGGTGWASFKNIYSAGGDTQFTIVNNGGLKRYRFDEDINWWANSGMHLSTSTAWSAFLDTTAVGNSCSRSYVAPTATVPVEPNAPLEALGSSSSGHIALAYSNAVGEQKFALLPNSESNAASWSSANDGDATSGRPALTESSDGLLHLFSHTTTGLTKEKVQVQLTQPGLSAATGHGGVLTGHADATTMSNGTTVLAASDAAGAIWARQQLGTQYAAWRQVGSGIAPNAQVTVERAATNTVAIHARTTDGRVVTRTVDSSGVFPATLPAPVDLGTPGTGATGVIAAMSYAGGAQRVAVTDTSGQVWTKAQDIASLAWAPTWTPIGGTAAGSPSIVLSPTSSRVYVVARAAGDNTVVVAAETAQGSGTFSDLSVIVDEWGSPAADPRALVADPTTFTYKTTDGIRRWGIVGYDANRTLWAWYANAAATNQLQRGSGAEGLEVKNLGKIPR